MQFSRKLTHAVVALACIGMVIPQVAFAAPKAATVPVVKARDVALTAQGDLVGAVLNTKGQPTKVVLTQNGKTVAQTQTAADGIFTLPKVKSGAYEIAVGDAKAPVRVWKAEAAPASAAKKMALVAQSAVRGQGEYCPPEGEYCPPQGGVLGGLDIITLWTITAATGALVLGAINQADLNDINDKLDAILVSP